MIDDDYLFLYLSDYLTNRDFINMSFVNKRFSESFIIAQLSKRLRSSLYASINNIIFPLKERKGREMIFGGLFYIGSLNQSCLYNNLIGASLSVQINAPLWVYKTDEHSVFGRENTNGDEFDVNCSDTEFAEISLYYLIDDNNDIYIHTIEFKPTVSVSEYHRNRRQAYLVIGVLMSAFLYSFSFYVGMAFLLKYIRYIYTNERTVGLTIQK